MRLVLYLLASGVALPIGLVLLGAGVLSGFRWPRLASAVSASGLTLALLSAVPVGLPLYGLLFASHLVWLAARGRSTRAQVLGGVLVLGSGLGVQAAAFLPPAAGPRPAALPVFVLGDSLSAGLAPEGVTWPKLLAETTGREVRNLAHPGARLRDGLRQAEQLPPGPSVVIVELGGNDLLSGAGPAAFGDALAAVLQRVSSEPERVTVMFELPLLPLQNRFGRIQRRVCDRLDVALIPRRVLAGAVALPGHTTDGLHLSREGHEWLARHVAAWL